MRNPDEGSMTVVLYVILITAALFLAIFLAIILPADASAAPSQPDLCTKWVITPPCCRTILGVRICSCFSWRCAAPTAGRVDGLASPLPGNKGGCGRNNWWTGLSCTVTDAGNGFVSAHCEHGLWFSRQNTARSFRLQQNIRVAGCENEGGELAPVRIAFR